MRSVSRNEHSDFRDGLVPWNRCRRCGAKLATANTGRRRYYCGDSCRRAGNRLRRRLGREWVAQQPWYPPWAAEAERHREERQRQADERKREAEEQRKLRDAMPPHVRRAYDEAKNASWRRQSQQLTELTIAIEVENLNEKHEKVLKPAGKIVKILDGSRTVEKLLWAAVQAANEHESEALFAKARKIAAEGLTPEDVAVTAYEDLGHFFRTWGTS